MAEESRLSIVRRYQNPVLPTAFLEPIWLFALKTLQIESRLMEIECRQFDAQFNRLLKTAEPYLAVIFHEWRREHGAAFPKSLGEMRRLMVRAGFSADAAFNKPWRVGEILPGIEGYLLRLQDRQIADSQPANRPDPAKRNRHRHAEVEQLVARYLENRRPKYRELIPSVIQGDSPSFRDFAAIFGPTAMATHFAGGDTCEAKRIKTAIQKTVTYRLKIRPLFDKPPMQPHGEGDLFPSDPDVNNILQNMRRQTENRQ